MWTFMYVVCCIVVYVDFSLIHFFCHLLLVLQCGTWLLTLKIGFDYISGLKLKLNGQLDRLATAFSLSILLN